MFTEPAKAVALACTHVHMPQVTPTGGSPELTATKYNFTSRMCPGIVPLSAAVAVFFKQQGWNRV